MTNTKDTKLNEWLTSTGRNKEWWIYKGEWWDGEGRTPRYRGMASGADTDTYNMLLQESLDSPQK